MARLLIVLTLVTIVIRSDSFRQTSFRSNGITNKRVIVLADFSALHDTDILSTSMDAFHHVLSSLHSDTHAIHGTFNLADAGIAAPPAPDAAVSPYTKVDKTGFIGGIADVMERAIDLSHNLMQKLGIKDTYGYSIVLLTIFSK